jgi:hypothetical protein
MGPLQSYKLWAHFRVRLGGASKPNEGSCSCKTPAEVDLSSLVPLLRLQKMGSELPTCNVMLSQCTQKNWVDTSGLDSNHIFRHVVLGNHGTATSGFCHWTFACVQACEQLLNNTILLLMLSFTIYMCIFSWPSVLKRST